MTLEAFRVELERTLGLYSGTRLLVHPSGDGDQHHRADDADAGKSSDEDEGKSSDEEDDNSNDAEAGKSDEDRDSGNGENSGNSGNSENASSSDGPGPSASPAATGSAVDSPQTPSATPGVQPFPEDDENSWVEHRFRLRGISNADMMMDMRKLRARLAIADALGVGLSQVSLAWWTWEEEERRRQLHARCASISPVASPPRVVSVRRFLRRSDQTPQPSYSLMRLLSDPVGLHCVVRVVTRGRGGQVPAPETDTRETGRELERIVMDGQMPELLVGVGVINSTSSFEPTVGSALWKFGPGSEPVSPSDNSSSPSPSPSPESSPRVAGSDAGGLVTLPLPLLAALGVVLFLLLVCVVVLAYRRARRDAVAHETMAGGSAVVPTASPVAAQRQRSADHPSLSDAPNRSSSLPRSYGPGAAAMTADGGRGGLELAPLETAIPDGGRASVATAAAEAPASLSNREGGTSGPMFASGRRMPQDQFFSVVGNQGPAPPPSTPGSRPAISFQSTHRSTAYPNPATHFRFTTESTTGPGVAPHWPSSSTGVSGTGPPGIHVARGDTWISRSRAASRRWTEDANSPQVDASSTSGRGDSGHGHTPSRVAAGQPMRVQSGASVGVFPGRHGQSMMARQPGRWTGHSRASPAPREAPFGRDGPLL